VGWWRTRRKWHTWSYRSSWWHLREHIDEANRSVRTDLKLVASYVGRVVTLYGLWPPDMVLVHRDIKPGNLLFPSDGRLLLGDFDIVRLKALPALDQRRQFPGNS